MKKTERFLILISLLFLFSFTYRITEGVAQDKTFNYDENGIKALVDYTIEELGKDPANVLKQINTAAAPYQSKTDKEFYVFIWNKDLLIVAHPNSKIAGQVVKGKPDVEGVCYRDIILKKSMANKEGGWQIYAYKKPPESGDNKTYCKKSYYKATKGKDGVDYIIAAGIYSDKRPPCKDDATPDGCN